MGIKLNKIHHIGYAVPSIVKAEPLFQVLGYERLDSRDVKDPMQNIRAVFLRHLYTEGYIIELLEPLDAQKPSTVDFIINKRKMGSLHAMPYHICYEVDNLMAAIAELRKEKFIPLSAEPIWGYAFGRKIIFMVHRDLGMVELLEKTPSEEK